MEKYMVGGCVRDEILGIPSKDIDFSVVLTADEIERVDSLMVGTSYYDFMVMALEKDGIKIIKNPKTGEIVGAEHLSARGISPTLGAVDYVLARRESGYSDGRRPDSVEPGTLEDDIRRRDFTMNALAKTEDGTIIDMVGGVQDINERVIRAVGDAFERLSEDALRAVRALRFSVTKGFRIDHELEFAMNTVSVLTAITENISDERIDDEISKMFRFDTVASLNALAARPGLTDAIFSGSVSLDSTMKTKGRGK